MFQQREVDELKRAKLGIWGLIGTNNEYNVHCVQSVVGQSDLNDITIVEEIPESQEWGVQDLIQRSVNKDRVNNGIIPYLNDDRKIKFFNPLTLILLPKKQGIGNKVEIDREIPTLEKGNKEFLLPGGTCETFTMPGFYELMTTNQTDSLGAVKWNPDKTILVAIDGQHRLKALQKLSKDPESSIQHWKVPVTIIVIHKNLEFDSNVVQSGSNDIIAAVRNIFVTINNSAKAISRTRTILLNDQLPLDVLTQEFVDFAHKKYSEEEEKINQLPLYFINWTKDAAGQDNSKHYLSIIEVEELNEILSEYFNYGKLSQIIDGNQDVVPKEFLQYVNDKNELDQEISGKFREKVKEDFIPGLHHLLRRILPIDRYIKDVNNLRSRENSDFKVKYAFQRDVFGIIDESGDFGQGYYENEFQNQIQNLRKKLPFALEQRAIGFRAISYMYSEIKKTDYFKNKKWMDLSKALVEPLNFFIKQGWFNNPDQGISDDILRVLADCVYSPTNSVLNYRANNIEDGLGGVVLFWVTKYLTGKTTFASDNSIIDLSEVARNNISSSYRKELRKVVKREFLENGNYNNSQEVKKEIERISDEKLLQKLETMDTVIDELVRR